MLASTQCENFDPWYTYWLTIDRNEIEAMVWSWVPYMMTPWQETFPHYITDPLWEESTGGRWITLTEDQLSIKYRFEKHAIWNISSSQVAYYIIQTVIFLTTKAL